MLLLLAAMAAARHGVGRAAEAMAAEAAAPEENPPEDWNVLAKMQYLAEEEMKS